MGERESALEEVGYINKAEFNKRIKTDNRQMHTVAVVRSTCQERLWRRQVKESAAV
jgi:hypothetical protein